MYATSFGHRTARRVAIAALFVMAPAWLSACSGDGAVPIGSAPSSGSTAPGSSSAETASDRTTASAANVSRTVTFDGETGKAAVSLPLIGVPTEYGVDESGEPPSLLPAADLPSQGFVVPDKLASKLAVYWMNLGYDDRGFMMLAPKGWKVTGSVGANGSFGMHGENPADAEQFLDTVDTAGSCQGCAIADIGAYFPELAKWAEDQGFPADKPKAYLSSKPIGDRMIEFTEAPGNANGKYGVLGAAYEEHQGGSLFRTARTGHAKADQAVAETMIAFYEWMYGGR
ncbi:DUF4850 domain-containing protein [Cohnella rhizosphaerae]|uniref:DUF4850 domain-containing protein n=1 Tax=Cohnella rhizosphaerae TaxID=1457232 RepID=A0A9X4KZK8_9BACL|nr:DUF4850 domain-containing protein [Cohnella rhizosphaerae]MDG0813738.1 DUF4850 domain-containing protein [Cohnella rhizosphaerae]